MAFADTFDMFFTLRHDLEKITSCKLPKRMMTDSKSLFDVLTKTTMTTKKRLIIDLQTVKNAYASFEVSDVALLLSKFNIADALTKVKTNSILLNTIKSKKIDHPIAQ